MAKQISRRKFLTSAALITVGFILPTGRSRADDISDTASGNLGAGISPNAWLTINSDNTVTIMSSTAEMGQGSFTSLPYMIAEELELSPSQVQIEHAPVGPEFVNQFFRFQATGGSTSVRWAYNPLRQIGADVRELLKNAAAEIWNTDVSELSAREAVVHHPDGRMATYAELAERATDMEMPSGTELKPRSEWRILGTEFKRKDTPEKITGQIIFGIDVQVEDMLIATIKACPTFGGKLVSVDPSPALAIRGVKNVVRLDDAVAVCAKDYWAAKKGLDALEPVWNLGPNAKLSTASIREKMLQELDAPGIEALNVGDMMSVTKEAASKHSITYEAPYLAHAAMEPMNATVDARYDQVKVWVPTQSLSRVQMSVARALQVPLDQVDVQATFMGGSFGRRGDDFAIQAALISKQAESPVKLVWSREEDMAHDFYRPMAIAQIDAHLDQNNKAVGLDMHASCQSITRSIGNPKAEKDQSISEGLADIAYAFDASRMDYRMTDVTVPVGYWRSVGHSQNTWIIESYIDELAKLEGVNPYQWRRERLAGNDRIRDVIDYCAEKAKWGKPAKGYVQGIAMAKSFGSVVAEVVEAKITDDGKIHIGKITCAVDCGLAINPDSVRAQMESSIVYGLTAGMYGEITIENGAALQKNFPQYEMMRLREMPRVDVHILESTGQPGGIGEPGLPPVMPALCNAIYAATGKPIHKLPLSSQGFSFS